MSALANTTRAIVAHEPQSNQLNLKLEHVTLRDIGPDELLIKVVAVGVCHTDLIFGTWPPEMIPYPKVLGHEGWSSFLVMWVMLFLTELDRLWYRAESRLRRKDSFRR